MFVEIDSKLLLIHVQSCNYFHTVPTMLQIGQGPRVHHARDDRRCTATETDEGWFVHTHVIGIRVHMCQTQLEQEFKGTTLEEILETNLDSFSGQVTQVIKALCELDPQCNWVYLACAQHMNKKVVGQSCPAGSMCVHVNRSESTLYTRVCVWMCVYWVGAAGPASMCT